MNGDMQGKARHARTRGVSQLQSAGTALALAALVVTLGIGDAAAQRRGGGGGARGGGGGQMAMSSVSSANRGNGNRGNLGGGNRGNGNYGGNGGNRGNGNRGNVNVGNNVNINIDNDYNGHRGGYYGGGRYPVAAGVVIGAMAVSRGAAIGSYYASLPSSCTIIMRGGVSYHYCGSVYYQQTWSGNDVVYVVVNP